MLLVDAETHTYRWNNKEVPSVTQILKAIGITRDYERVDPYYKERGTLVHQAIHFYIRGTLDEGSVDERNVRPYLNAFKSFEKNEGYTPQASEIPLYSKKHKFAGTIDQLGTLAGCHGVGIIDLKATENSDKAADLQLCGYAQLFYENYGHWPAFRMALELHGDGSNKPIDYTTHPKIWAKSVMELYRWKITRRPRQSTTSKP